MTPDLIAALEAGATLVTPNRRLARDLARRFDAVQLAAGRAAWRSADVLPLSAWLQRAYAEAMRDEDGAAVLGASQELALWHRMIGASRLRHELLDIAAAARNVADAHLLRHAWRLDVPRARLAVSDETRAYLEWADAFDQACRDGGWLPAARVPDALAERLPALGSRRPRALLAYGFDQLSPQQEQLFAALRASGTHVDVRPVAPVASRAVRVACADAEREWTAVAGRVRALLDADAQLRIGVVVPQLAARRAAVLRVFDRVLDPGRVLPGAADRAPGFDVSLGVPLADYPLVHAALSVLRLAQGALPLTEAGALLRSPYLGAAEYEFLRRAQLDAHLRWRGRLTVDAQWLLEVARGRDPHAAHACRQLAARLEAWLPLAAQARAQRQLPSDWSVAFLALLSTLGWPGERTLSSGEYQTWVKLRELLSGLSQLDAVLGRLRLDDALAWIARLCAQTPFQPEAEAASVQILGSLESVGLEFDHLFVTGLHDEAWPEPARPNPFLPLALQRAHGVPHSSAQWELAFARRMSELWRGAAPHVTFSHPTRDADRELRASPLLADLAPADLSDASLDFARQMWLGARLEQVPDDLAPPLPDGFEAPGGVGVFEDQAACPFRAFAVHRLGAEPLEEGRPALDARERGNLLHRALAGLWGELESHERLVALPADAAAALVERAVAAAIAWMRGRRPDALGSAFAALERERLIGLLSRLLDLERTRAPFRVLAVESPRLLDIGGLRAHGKVDRIDALADGRHAVIDYKTGRAGIGQWRDARPDAPQLPLYAITDPGEVAALAFALLRPERVQFRGLASAADLLPGVNPPDPPQHWDELLPQWRATLAALAREFLAGHAAVAPKRYPRTCEYCSIGPLCRVRELFDRGPVSADEDLASADPEVADAAERTDD